MKSACSFVCFSVTVVPKQSQLFHPMGGVGAQAWKSAGAGAELAARRVPEASKADMARRLRGWSFKGRISLHPSERG